MSTGMLLLRDTCHWCARCLCIAWDALQATTFASVCASCPFAAEAKGGSLGSAAPSRKWQRRQLNLCSVPPSLHPPSLTAPLCSIDRSEGKATWISMILQPLETFLSMALMYNANTNGCHWPVETHTHVQKCESSQCTTMFHCQSQGEYGDPCTMKLMNYQLIMNVNYEAHTGIHHPRTRRVKRSGLSWQVACMWMIGLHRPCQLSS